MDGSTSEGLESFRNTRFLLQKIQQVATFFLGKNPQCWTLWEEYHHIFHYRMSFFCFGWYDYHRDQQVSIRLALHAPYTSLHSGFSLSPPNIWHLHSSFPYLNTSFHPSCLLQQRFHSPPASPAHGACPWHGSTLHLPQYHGTPSVRQQLSGMKKEVDVPHSFVSKRSVMLSNLP